MRTKTCAHGRSAKRRATPVDGCSLPPKSRACRTRPRGRRRSRLGPERPAGGWSGAARSVAWRCAICQRSGAHAQANRVQRVMNNPSLFEQLGGEPKLRAIIDRFVDRVFDDIMIGFFFRRANRDRIKAKEYEFAAAHLGADVEYTGRPLAEAHAAHPIMGGQFLRRLKILEEVLDEFEVPPEVKRHWVLHRGEPRAGHAGCWQRLRSIAAAERAQSTKEQTR
ncbi:MAG: group 1 truncated hemoglobin [Polyangiaceae bacterium]